MMMMISSINYNFPANNKQEIVHNNPVLPCIHSFSIKTGVQSFQRKRADAEHDQYQNREVR